MRCVTSHACLPGWLSLTSVDCLRRLPDIGGWYELSALEATTTEEPVCTLVVPRLSLYSDGVHVDAGRPSAMLSSTSTCR